MENNVDQFLADFNTLHRLMKAELNDKDLSFASAVQQLSQKHPVIKKHHLDLDAIRELRNLLVHEKLASDEDLANPSNSTVAILQEIINKMTMDSRVGHYQKNVISLTANQSLAKVLNLMSKEKYSQYPVFKDTQLIGILSAEVITHWLAQEDLKQIDLNQTQCQDLLRHQKNKQLSDKNFVTPDFSCFKLDDRFLELLQDNRYPIVLIIEPNKEPSPKSLKGILTPWDLPKILENA